MEDLVIVIPARGGSKRIPDKNIAPLAGKPLLAWTVEAALQSAVSRAVLVSTDSPRIAAVGRQHGARVVERPPALASDDTSTEAVLLHALVLMANTAWSPRYVLTLPPTSPLRTASTIRKFVSAFGAHRDRFDAMISLTEDRGDYWLAGENGAYSRLFPDAPRRQQGRTPLYEENSALYLTRVDALRQTGSILGRSVAGFVLDPVEAVDINDPLDLAWAEFLLARRMASGVTQKGGSAA
jgi:CMP-N,N'-diacetyllegionaminic acid synthase